MNIELKPIAESKVRHLGGDVCGVLVRNEAGRLAAVDEHGRVQWLDDELSSNPEPLSSKQAASAQSGQGAEPMAWYLPGEGGCDSQFRDHATVNSCTGNPWAGWQPLYTHPKPAQQGSVPEEAVSLARKWLGITESSLLHNDDITKMAEALLATSQPAQQGIVAVDEREALIRELRQQSRRVRNYSNPDDVFDAVPVRALMDEANRPHPPKSQAVPEGWKLVPIEPTAAMISTFEHAPCAENYLDAATWSWEAMLSATPQPPQEGEGDD